MEESLRSDPSYMAEIIAQKRQDDPKETAIREKIRAEVLQQDWAPAAFERVKQLQTDYLREAIAHHRDHAYVHELSQQVIAHILDVLPSSIVEGKEHLAGLRKGEPVLIATNHFGAYKLLGISAKTDLGVDIPGYDDMYPFPMYFAALQPVAAELGDGLYYSSNDFPGVFGDIHSSAGHIHVPAVKEGRTAALIEQTREVLAARPASAVVIFPEGTTSGKPTGLGPYALNPFKTGAYVISAEMALPMVPVAQYFDPKEGFKLKIFPPITPAKGDKASYEALAQQHRDLMQGWLDEVSMSTRTLE